MTIRVGTFGSALAELLFGCLWFGWAVCGLDGPFVSLSTIVGGAAILTRYLTLYLFYAEPIHG
jgi:hypothetical protein